MQVRYSTDEAALSDRAPERCVYASSKQNWCEQQHSWEQRVTLYPRVPSPQKNGSGIESQLSACLAVLQIATLVTTSPQICQRRSCVSCPLPHLTEKVQIETVCTVEILIKNRLTRLRMNRILPFSPNFVKKVKISEFGYFRIPLWFSLHFLYLLLLHLSFFFPLKWPVLVRVDPFWWDSNCASYSDDGCFQLHHECTWWMRQVKDGWCVLTAKAVLCCFWSSTRILPLP